jgi:hypothetical protein
MNSVADTAHFLPNPDPDPNKFSAKFLLEICLAKICSKKYIHEPGIFYGFMGFTLHTP